MMNWILLVMAAVASVVVAMIVGGLLSPRVRTSTRTLLSDSPADQLYQLLREADGPPRWCPDLPSMHVQAEQPPHEIVFALRSDDGAPLGTWAVTVHERDGRTVASIVETVTVNNPVVRFLRSFGGSGARAQRFLEAIAAQTGGTITAH